MNKIKFLSLSLLALLMACFTACENKYNVDHTAHIVGTWTYIGPNYAEVLVIKEDGSVLSTGIENGEYWENVAGTIKIKGNVATMTFEDGDDAIGHIDVVPGIAFSIYEEDGEEWTFNYCAEDFSDEIVGMWVSTDNSSIEENNVLIQTFYENGKSTFTGFGEIDGEIVKNKETNYKVCGDVSFQEINGKYIAWKVAISHNGTSLGDIMTNTNGGFTSTWVRVKQDLNFTGKVYGYNSAYVTNVKGKDEDFTIFGNTFNIAKITAYDFEKLFGADLYNVELNANLFKYRLLLDNGQEAGADIPMTIVGNKVTLDFSAAHPACRKVDRYMFQDADDSQLHIYMHTASFINYFANLKVLTMPLEGNYDLSDTAAVEKVFTDMEARVESINVSFVFKARK